MGLIEEARDSFVSAGRQLKAGTLRFHDFISDSVDRLKQGLVSFHSTATEHFTPLESGKRAAQIHFQEHRDNASERVDDFLKGNQVEYHPGLFSEKVQIRRHFGDAFDAFRDNGAERTAFKQAHKQRRHALQERYLGAEDMVHDRIADIRMAISGGREVSERDLFFIRKIDIQGEKGIAEAAREIRKEALQEMRAEKADYKAHFKPLETARDRAETVHDKRIDHFKTIDTHAKEIVHREVQILKYAQAHGIRLNAAAQEASAFLEAHGEKAMVKRLRNQASEAINVENASFRAYNASVGSPFQRLFASIGIVASEAAVATENTIRNVGIGTSFGLERVGSAIGLGAHYVVDHAKAATYSVAHGVKDSVHGATVKPIVAGTKAMKSTLAT